MRLPFILILGLICLKEVKSQSYLIYETRGSIKPKKFPIGATIRFHLKQDKNYLWHTYTIWDLDEKNKCIRVSENFCVPLSDIDGFDLSPEGNPGIPNMIKRLLLPFTAYTIVQYFTGPALTVFHFGTIGISSVTWFLAKYIFTGKQRIHTRHRLRIINLTLVAPKA